MKTLLTLFSFLCCCLFSQILEIPELGDDGAGDITTQVAAPPKEFKQQRMQSISQLDKDVQYHLPSETSIDLSMLTMSLSRADKVHTQYVIGFFYFSKFTMTLTNMVFYYYFRFKKKTRCGQESLFCKS